MARVMNFYELQTKVSLKPFQSQIWATSQAISQSLSEN